MSEEEFNKKTSHSDDKNIVMDFLFAEIICRS